MWRDIINSDSGNALRASLRLQDYGTLDENEDAGPPETTNITDPAADVSLGSWVRSSYSAQPLTFYDSAAGRARPPPTQSSSRLNTPEEERGTLRNVSSLEHSNDAFDRDTSSEEESVSNMHLHPPGHSSIPKSMSSTIFFNDGKKPIDFVLAYQPAMVSGSKATSHGQYRLDFERKLKQQGLKLEYEGVELSQDGKTCFVKIHAPWEVLARTAEINRVKMPIRINDIPDKPNASDWLEKRLKTKNPFKLEKELIVDEPEYFTAAFSRDRVHQFLIKDKSTFFSSVQRIRMVWDIILRTTVDLAHTGNTPVGSRPECVGMKWLIRENVYVAAFPLHDGDCKPEDEFERLMLPIQWPLRRWLYESWSRPGRWTNYQPLTQIRNYYGEKVGIYFAWLGFYTQMLVLPAIVGTLCFIYGLGRYSNDIPRNDVCGNAATMNMTMCRLCPKKVCPFKSLNASCTYATLTYIFDNSSTVFFAFFVSIWAVVFLELWKRYQAELSWDWDVRDMEFIEENVRPEYQATVKTMRINPVTQTEEPYMPLRKQIQRFLASLGTVAFMVFVVLAILAGIIFYRIVGSGLYYQLHNPLIEKISAPIMTSMTAAGINAVCILVLGKLYERLAWLLTCNECPRTETDFETSYTYKVFVFEFVNYYAALFYIAFFKGKIFGPPSSKGYVDRCDPVGCLIDVCIQLAAIMIVKQIMSNVVEIAVPLAQNWWKRRQNVAETEDNKYTRWEKDFDLSPFPQLGLFDEYLEMIIQFGFVTMFVAAFPLAPLFALLNNVIEIRLDSYKITTQFRRPVPLRAQNIGAWYRVLEIVTKIAVITNSLVIAFSSDFVDRLVYVAQYSPDGSLRGYMRHVFSKFDTSSWTNPALRTSRDFGNVTECYYRDYRHVPGWKAEGVDEPYERTRTWWHVLVARLFFVLVFEHVVFFIQGAIQYFIPDVPEHVSHRIQREQFLSKQALYKHEFESGLLNQDAPGQPTQLTTTQEANVDQISTQLIVTDADIETPTANGDANKLQRRTGMHRRGLHSPTMDSVRMPSPEVGSSTNRLIVDGRTLSDQQSAEDAVYLLENTDLIL